MSSHITKGPEEQVIAQSPTFFYSSARQGFLDLLTNGRNPHGQHRGVLLPAYIGWSQNEGSGVFDPVRASGRPFGFYDLHADLSSNIESLRTELEAGAYSHIVLIHYFGRLDPNREFVYQLAREHGAIVIDDLAHGFHTARNHPAHLEGEVKLYSLHKQFPLDYGGQICYSGPTLIKGQATTRPELASAILGYDWNKIADIRIRNFRLLTDALAQNDRCGNLFQMLWGELETSAVPQTLPVILQQPNRDALYFALNGRGIGATSLYHTLIPETAGQFQNLHNVSARILNLPIHQDVSEADVSFIAETFLNLVGNSDPQ